jgi:hypothetical protein
VSLPLEIAKRLDALLGGPAFAVEPGRHHAGLMELLRDELAHAADCNARLRNYYRAWPIDWREAETIADLPYLPVAAFKANPPLSLVTEGQITKTLASSATTGQTPSRVVLDAETAKRMAKGIMAIIRSFIGPARRPYLVVDTAESLAGVAELGARSAAIQGLRPFSSEVVCCLDKGDDGELALDEARLFEFARRCEASEVLVYGFTHILWQQFAEPLRAKGVCLNMPNVRVLHSGGWKRLESQAVTRAAFAEGIAAVFGCSESHIIDFYGMVENVGVVYPDCEHGNKHVPAFGEVIIRDPLTLSPVRLGESGLIQVCSTLPSSFPGFLVLTDDIGTLVHDDGCACGRRGTAFRFESRAPKAEVRGCGNVERAREHLFHAAM